MLVSQKNITNQAQQKLSKSLLLKPQSVYKTYEGYMPSIQPQNEQSQVVLYSSSNLLYTF